MTDVTSIFSSMAKGSHKATCNLKWSRTQHYLVPRKKKNKIIVNSLIPIRSTINDDNGLRRERVSMNSPSLLEKKLKAHFPLINGAMLEEGIHKCNS
jgi:hypothetical protein